MMDTMQWNHLAIESGNQNICRSENHRIEQDELTHDGHNGKQCECEDLMAYRRLCGMWAHGAARKVETERREQIYWMCVFL